MKYAMIILSGSADGPVAALDGRTPLEAANTPQMDWISKNGRQGTVATIPTSIRPAGDVAGMSLLGYDPRKHYTGCGPLEAAARGLSASPGQLIFRCNFVTLVDGVMVDTAGGHITQTEANRLIDDLNQVFADESAVFYGGVSYRNLLIVTTPSEQAPVCTPPHDFPGQHVESFLPTGDHANPIIKIMNRAHSILANHEVNIVRRDMGENPVTDIWPWGPGAMVNLPDFEQRFATKGAVIAAVDSMRGIAKCAGLDLLNVDGATGYLNTNYRGKGAAGVDALDRYDLVVVHVQAPDEASHFGDVNGKVNAIEQADEFIVGPVLEKARSHKAWRVMVATDHVSQVETQMNAPDASPFCLAGKSVQGTLQKPFTEAFAQTSDLHVDRGCDLMEYFLRA